MAILRPEGSCELKIPTPSGIEPATFQLRHRVPLICLIGTDVSGEPVALALLS